jgi:uncharacterized protein YjbJ (UPF0337 family)
MNTTSKVASPFMIKGNWTDHAKKLKAKFPSLTDEDLEFSNGKLDDLINRIEVRLGKRKDEVVSILTKIQAKFAL